MATEIKGVLMIRRWVFSWCLLVSLPLVAQADPQSFMAITPADWTALNAQISTPMTVKAHTLTTVVGDAGVKIAAAIALLPVNVGGTVDATGFTNPQNLTGFTIPPGVTVELGPVFFTMPTASPSIIVNQGARLIGAGANSPGATTIKAYTGFNKDIIRCISTGGEGAWWHHGEVRNIRVIGNKPLVTTGNGLSVFGLAETSLIQRVSIEGAAQSGLYIKGSQSGTGSIENVTVNSNAVYGVHLDQFRSAILLKSVGGDQNPITYAITNAQQGGGAVTLIDPKSEGTLTNDPDPVVLIQGGSAKVTLTIIGGNFLTPNTNKTAIRIAADVGIDPGIQIMGLFTGNHMPTLIDDVRTGNIVTTAPTTHHQFFAYNGGKYMRFDETGLTKIP